MVETKVQHVKYIEKPKTVTAEEKKKVAVIEPMRREDSNLSRKSLTKFKAALAKPTTTAINNAAKKVLAVKKPESSTNNAKTSTDLKDSKAIKKPTKPEIKIVSVQTHSSKLLSDIEDIDIGDKDNLILVSEYVNDIYDYLYTLEVEQDVQPDHLSGQLEVYPKMRAVLIDWINEVHLQFHLTAETFQMTVGIIDRYLQAVKDTKRSHLQLVGVTALFLAAKYEELFPPSIADFVYITDDTYTDKQILQMEVKIFKTLDFNLSRPVAIHFLRRYSKAAKAEDEHHSMSKYFVELASIEYDMASYKPSEIAAASLFLSLHLLMSDATLASGFNNSHWNATLQWYSRYTADDLRPITKKIATIARNAPKAKLKAVYTKYQSSKFHKISLRTELYGALMDSIIASK